MEVSPATLDAIQGLLNAGMPYDRVARKTGASEPFVRRYDIDVLGRFRTSNDGRGRPEMRKYHIATRHADATWDMNLYPLIRQARASYDAGTTDMVTGRDGFNIHLYSIPRVNVDKKRRPFFSRNFGEG